MRIMEFKKKQLISTVMLLTLLGKVIGFLRETTLSYYYGTSIVSDAYVLSQTIPGTLFQFVGIGLSTCFLPIYIGLNVKDNNKKIGFTNKVFTLVLLLSLFFIAFVFLFDDFVISVFASGLSGDAYVLAKIFTKIGVLSLVFSTFVYVSNCILNAEKIFTITVLAAVPYGLAIIASIILSSWFGVLTLIIGSTLANLVQAVFVYMPVRKKGIRFGLDFRFNDDNVICFCNLLAPVILATLTSQIQVIVDKNIASHLLSGAISSLNYANEIILIPLSVFSNTIATMYYPKLTECVKQKKNDEATQTFEYALLQLVYLLLPCAMLFAISPVEIISVVFERGMFDKTATSITSVALLGYSAGIVFIGIQNLMLKMYYANNSVKFPTVASFLAIVVNILLNIFLSRRFGIIGISVATSIAAVFSVLCLGLYGSKKIGLHITQIGTLKLMKIALASFGSGLLLWIIKNTVAAQITNNSMILLILSCVIMLISYICLTKVLRVDYLRSVFDGVR